MENWTTLATDKLISQTIEALKNNGINAVVVENGSQAKDLVLKTIPEGAEVMAMTSQTLDAIGVTKEINESGNYDSIKAKLFKMDKETEARAMQKLGSSPEWTIASVHAVTLTGSVLIASGTGSQLSASAYTSPNVIWVVGTQKIVKDIETGIKRIYDYCLPKESDRLKAKGHPFGTMVAKLLIINKELRPGRITLIFVKENLGF